MKTSHGSQYQASWGEEGPDYDTTCCECGSEWARSGRASETDPEEQKPKPSAKWCLNGRNTIVIEGEDMADRVRFEDIRRDNVQRALVFDNTPAQLEFALCFVVDTAMAARMFWIHLTSKLNHTIRYPRKVKAKMPFDPKMTIQSYSAGNEGGIVVTIDVYGMYKIPEVEGDPELKGLIQRLRDLLMYDTHDRPNLVRDHNHGPNCKDYGPCKTCCYEWRDICADRV